MFNVHQPGSGCGGTGDCADVLAITIQKTGAMLLGRLHRGQLTNPSNHRFPGSGSIIPEQWRQ